VTVLSAAHLVKRFRRGGGLFEAVSDAGLSVDAGEVVSVTGRSGSGKTTLLLLLGGLLYPDQGRVEIGGEAIHDLGDEALAALRNEKIGFAPQTGSLLGALSVLDNVRLPLHLAGRRGPSRARAMELLESLSVAHLAESLPRTLSGGEIRRAALARALAGSPDLVLADEPTSHLDEAGARDLMAALRGLAGRGTAFLLATHDPMVASLSDRRLTMADGVLSAG
jgi:putative ABC transport system ATP-binding protein